MTSVCKYSKIQVLLLSLISMVALPSTAGAAPTIGGRFTLSSETKWGSIVLPAGEYTYAVEENSSLPMVLIYSSNGKGQGFVFPTSAAETEYPEKGKIAVEIKDGETVVTAVYVEELGLVLHYNARTTRAEIAQKKTTPRQKMDSYSAAK
jgi:hypothetical protein